MSLVVMISAVWVYHHFVTRLRDVECLLAKCGVIVSRKSIRRWGNRFGTHLTTSI